MCVYTQLDEKAQELSQVQKSVVELRCELDSERAKWLADKSQVQADLDDALRDRDAERGRAAQLNAEVWKSSTCVSRDPRSAEFNPQERVVLTRLHGHRHPTRTESRCNGVMASFHPVASWWIKRG